MKTLTREELRLYIDSPLVLELPNNTQFLERLVQQATSVGKAAADPEKRDGILKAKLSMQKSVSRSATKAEFARLE